jgi:hypothetical protein
LHAPRRRDSFTALIVRKRNGHDIAMTLRAAYLALHRRSEARFVPHDTPAGIVPWRFRNHVHSLG